MRIHWWVVGALVLSACGGAESGLAEPATSTRPPTRAEPPPTEPPPTETLAPPVTGSSSELTSTTTPPGPPRHEVWGFVSEHEERGTILCLGVLVGPPNRTECGEPVYEVVGLDWDRVVPPLPDGTGRREWHLLLTGTLEGERLVLTEQPALRSEPPPPTVQALDLGSACDPPPGGWTVTDPATTTSEALEAAVAYAEGRPGFGGWWIDRESMDGSVPGVDDPTRVVLNVRFTGRLEQRERELRERWGGALCVAEARYTRSEMEDIERRLVAELEGVGLTAVHAPLGKVLISMAVVPHGLQEELDERFGREVVLVSGQFRPVEP